MTPPRTLRRKLQKKKKAKPYRKCPKCGWRMECRVFQQGDRVYLFKECGLWFTREYGCFHREELFWKNRSRDGTADVSLTEY